MRKKKAGKHSLPIVLRMSGRPVVLVGEGPAAEKHRRILERAGARVVNEGSRAALAVVIDDPAAVSRMKVRGSLVYAVGHPQQSDFTLADAFEPEPEPDHPVVPAPEPAASAPIDAPVALDISGEAAPAVRPRLHALADALARSMRRSVPTSGHDGIPIEIGGPPAVSSTEAPAPSVEAMPPDRRGFTLPESLETAPAPKAEASRRPHSVSEPEPEPAFVPPAAPGAITAPLADPMILEPISRRSGLAFRPRLHAIVDALARSVQAIPRPGFRPPPDRISLEIALAKGGPLEAADISAPAADDERP